MDKSRRERADRRTERNTARRDSLRGLLRDIAAITDASPLRKPAEFDDACDAVVESAEAAFDVQWRDDPPVDDPPVDDPPVDDPPVDDRLSAGRAFKKLIKDGHACLIGSVAHVTRLDELEWEVRNNAVTANAIGAALPDDFEYRTAHASYNTLLCSYMVRVDIFFDWYSTLPNSMRATAMVQNCYEYSGWADYSELVFELTTSEGTATHAIREEHGSCNTIRPRGVVPIRLEVGLFANAHEMWEGMPTPQIAPEWLESYLAEKCIDELGEPYTVGPYPIYYKNYHNLGDSHGGWSIPFHGGGARCWTAGNWRGYVLREREFLGVVARSPIVARNADGSPFMPGTPYWLGDSSQAIDADKNHVPPEYNYASNTSRCTYAPELASFNPPDYSHQWRMLRAAAMLAPFDSAARWWVVQCWNECKRWLKGNDASDAEANSLFWSLRKRVAFTCGDVGASWAGRGFAHVVATLAAAYPYIGNGQRWAARIGSALWHVQMPDGNVLASNEKWEKATHKNGGPIPNDAFRAAAREEQLLVCALRQLAHVSGNNLLLQVALPLADAVGMEPGEVYTVNVYNSRDFERIASQLGYFPGYDHMTLHEWSSVPGAAECLEEARKDPLNECILDWTPRSMWEAGVQ